MNQIVILEKPNVAERGLHSDLLQEKKTLLEPRVEQQCDVLIQESQFFCSMACRRQDIDPYIQQKLQPTPQVDKMAESFDSRRLQRLAEFGQLSSPGKRIRLLSLDQSLQACIDVVLADFHFPKNGVEEDDPLTLRQLIVLLAKVHHQPFRGILAGADLAKDIHELAHFFRRGILCRGSFLGIVLHQQFSSWFPREDTELGFLPGLLTLT